MKATVQVLNKNGFRFKGKAYKKGERLEVEPYELARLSGAVAVLGPKEVIDGLEKANAKAKAKREEAEKKRKANEAVEKKRKADLSKRLRDASAKAEKARTEKREKEMGRIASKSSNKKKAKSGPITSESAPGLVKK